MRSLPLAVAAGLSVAAFLIGFFDAPGDYRWVMVAFYLSSVFISAAAGFRSIDADRWTNRDRALFCSVIVFSHLVHVLYLEYYPFIAAGDELRDGGYNTLLAATGQLKDFTGYGPYNSHGRLVSILFSPFYLLFPGSVLAYRMPGALIASAEAGLLYTVVRRHLDARTAFWSAVVLSVVPLHIFHARTESLISINSLLITALVGVCLELRRSRTAGAFLLLGLLFGLGSNFHAAGRIAVTIGTAFLLAEELFLRRRDGRLLLRDAGAWALGAVVGYGPHLLRTTHATLFQTEKQSVVMAAFARAFAEQSVDAFTAAIGELYRAYQTSLLGIFWEPLRSHAPISAPILTMPFAVLAVLGLIAILVTPLRRTWWPMAAMILVVPLTHSALTDNLNAGQRFITMVPILSTFAGFGISRLFLHGSFFLTTRTFVAALYVCWCAVSFFVEQQANRLYRDDFYVGMQVVRMFQNRPYPAQLCISGDQAMAEYFRTLHAKEQFEYFFPGLTLSSVDVPNGNFTVREACAENRPLRKVIIDCEVDGWSQCPYQRTEPMEFFVDW